jgi:PIN domain nuclease of toxin-antitoxin system
MRHVVDAHPFLWFLAGSSRLGPNAGAVLSDPQSDLIMPATALAEACWIVEHGRVPLTLDRLLDPLDHDPRFTFWPLDRAVIERSNEITAITEMHDRQIVATCLLLVEQGEQVALLTRDQNITASGLVPVLW